jgi:hypothetical protein
MRENIGREGRAGARPARTKESLARSGTGFKGLRKTSCGRRSDSVVADGFAK